MKISVIGTGNMALAIIGAVAKSGRMSPTVFYTYDKFKTQTEKAVALGALSSDSLSEVLDCSEFVLLSVKPQDVNGAIDEIKAACPDFDKKIYISICAGISSKYICEAFGCEVPVIRVMPNAPMMIGAGATAISRNSYVNDKNYSKICGIFSFGGTVASIPEEHMNAIISVNSSSPAYFYEIARIMIEYAKSQGIEEKVARSMTQGAMYGAAKMLMSSEGTPDELISVVKSKKGTTEAALDSFSSNNLEKVFFEAMDACTKRAVELGK